MFQVMGMFDRSLGMFQPFGALTAFTPAALFAAGEQGAWYDPSDGAFNWRYNLLTYTEQFDNAYWLTNPGGGNVTTITANQTTAPDGTTTADLWAETTANNYHNIITALASRFQVISGVAYTMSVYAKKGPGATAPDIIQMTHNGSFFGTSQYANFNISTGTVTTEVGSTSGYPATITSVGNGWYRITFTATCTVSDAAGGFGQYLFVNNNPTAARAPTYIGATTSNMYIWGASLTTAADASRPYQQIVTPEISYLTYDPDPVLFQDSAGTTPVTAIEQPVGLILDKSKGLVLGPELVTNGDFATDTAWTKGTGWIISSGVATELGNQFTQLSQILTTVSGVTYKLTFTANIVSGTFGVYARQNTTSGTTLASKTDITAAGSYQIIFTATSAATAIFFTQLNLSAVSTITIDNVYVKSIAGNHASQPTTTSRPILRNLYNLLTYTEQFNNAAWTKATGGSISATDSTTAPDGTVTADTWLQTGTPGGTAISQTTTVSSTGTYSASVYVKKITGSFFRFNVLAPGGASYFAIGFNLDTGSVGTPTQAGSGWSYVSSAVVDAGNGWWKFTLTGNVGGTSVIPYMLISDGIDSGTRLANGSCYLWGASFTTANEASIPYQRVVTNTLGSGVYNTDLTKFPPYLFFDGSDDWLQTANIDFSATDKMSVFAGVRKLSDVAVAMIAELSATSSGANPGSFGLWNGGVSAGDDGYIISTRGTALAYTPNLNGYASPITNVLTGLSVIATDYLVLRINSIQAASSAMNQGAGNYGTYPLYIGRRAGTTLPFNGRIYSLIIRGALTSSPQLEQTEKWVAVKTGVTL